MITMNGALSSSGETYEVEALPEKRWDLPDERIKREFARFQDTLKQWSLVRMENRDISSLQIPNSKYKCFHKHFRGSEYVAIWTVDEKRRKVKMHYVGKHPDDNYRALLTRIRQSQQ